MDNRIIDKGWDRMKKDLDQYLPVDNRRRKGILWLWFIGAIGSLMLGLAVYAAMESTNSIQPVAEKASPVKPANSLVNSSVTSTNETAPASPLIKKPTKNTVAVATPTQKQIVNEQEFSSDLPSTPIQQNPQSKITASTLNEVPVDKGATSAPYASAISNSQLLPTSINAGLAQKASTVILENRPPKTSLSISPIEPLTQLILVSEEQSKNIVMANPSVSTITPLYPTVKNHNNELTFHGGTAFDPANVLLRLGYNRILPLHDRISMHLGGGLQYRSFSESEFGTTSGLRVEDDEIFEGAGADLNNKYIQNSSLKRQYSGYINLGVSVGLFPRLSLRNAIRGHRVIGRDQLYISELAATAGFNEVYRIEEEAYFLMSEHSLSYAIHDRIAIQAGIQLRLTPATKGLENYTFNESTYFASAGLGFRF